MLASLTNPDAFQAPALPGHAPPRIKPREKAAIIVRLLLSEGAPIPLSALPEEMQTALAQQMGQMRRVSRATLRAVVEEFMAELDQVGLSFPGGLEGALSIMDGHLSANAASRLRRMSGANSSIDPWERISALSFDHILPVLEEESIEVCAVVLSKLPVPRAAELLSKFPGERARQVAYAVSLTGNVDPDTVRRIGMALASQLDSQPLKAFDVGPGERVGAILNIAAAATRDDVLRSLQETDADFAQIVKKNIFTFEHIKAKLGPRDVPKVIRVVDQVALVTALSYALANPDLEPSAEHILASLSQRMTQTLREEIGQRGKIKEKDGEEAMGVIVMAIRQLEGSGEIVLVQPEE
ncbi:flagellar motor switch protein FliG [bacterium]|nr:flagellar motor switch protein FliG [bacterium]